MAKSELPCVESENVRVLRLAIDPIAQDRMSFMGAMHPGLMGAASL